MSDRTDPAAGEPTDDASPANARDPQPMSDTTTTDESSGTEPDGESSGRVRRYVDYALLAGLLLLALVAVLQFYLSVGSAINTWVTPEYRSLFRALFNLAVLLAVGAGLAYQLRRMDLGGNGTN